MGNPSQTYAFLNNHHNKKQRWASFGGANPVLAIRTVSQVTSNSGVSPLPELGCLAQGLPQGCGWDIGWGSGPSRAGDWGGGSSSQLAHMESAGDLRSSQGRVGILSPWLLAPKGEPSERDGGSCMNSSRAESHTFSVSGRPPGKSPCWQSQSHW